MALRTDRSNVTFDNVRVTAQSGVLTYMHSDHLGSNRLLTSSSGGAVVGSTIRYYPFGHWRTAPTADLTDRGFTGHLHDMNVGLIYMNARWYSAGVARFLSPDTIVPNPANPQSFNRYSYVLNSPLNFTDPTGHQECDLLCQQQNERTTSNITDGSAWGGSWDVEQQQENAEHAETILTTIRDFGCGMFDPCDIANTGYRAATGQAGWFEAAAVGVPLVPGIVGHWIDDVVSLGGKYWDEAVDFINGLCSFSADTLVMTEDGLVPISEVPLETLVLAYNEETGEVAYYPVVAIWAHEDPLIVHLTIDGETIETTPEHPFFTSEGEWIPAGKLQPGDEIRDAAWGTGMVEGVTFTATSQTMYNFTVGDAHTYFVGDGEWLVHNSCPLRNNIGAQAGEQAHHLIPNQRQNHPFVQRAIAGGWDQHASYNGIALPNNANAATSGPYHVGPHPNYTAMVTQNLDTLQTQATQQTWSNARAFQELQNLAQQMRTYISNIAPGNRLD